jgi:hypothetical protein
MKGKSTIARWPASTRCLRVEGGTGLYEAAAAGAGVEEGSDAADDNARASEVTKVTKDGARHMGTGSSGTFVDPQETLL